MKILDYEMVECVCGHAPALVKRVQERLAQGWEVYGSPMMGGPAGDGKRLFQAMVRPHPLGNKSCRWVAPTATEPGRWEPIHLPAP
jgi:hypothetical protein